MWGTGAPYLSSLRALRRLMRAMRAQESVVVASKEIDVTRAVRATRVCVNVGHGRPLPVQPESTEESEESDESTEESKESDESVSVVVRAREYGKTDECRRSDECLRATERVTKRPRGVLRQVRQHWIAVERVK
jgi:hypothetical protein